MLGQPQSITQNGVHTELLTARPKEIGFGPTRKIGEKKQKISRLLGGGCFSTIFPQFSRRVRIPFVGIFFPLFWPDAPIGSPPGQRNCNCRPSVTQLLHALSLFWELSSAEAHDVTHKLHLNYSKYFTGILFSAHNCAGKQGSWDDSILELHALALHARHVFAN